jgi:hypothetical protein
MLGLSGRGAVEDTPLVGVVVGVAIDRRQSNAGPAGSGFSDGSCELARRLAA